MLRGARAGSWWAPVRRAVLARAAPDPGAPVVARLSRRTPEGKSNLVLVLRRAEDETGRTWIRARLAVLPNNTTGWIPRDALAATRAYRRVSRNEDIVTLGRLMPVGTPLTIR